MTCMPPVSSPPDPNDGIGDELTGGMQGDLPTPRRLADVDPARLQQVGAPQHIVALSPPAEGQGRRVLDEQNLGRPRLRRQRVSRALLELEGGRKRALPQPDRFDQLGRWRWWWRAHLDSAPRVR